MPTKYIPFEKYDRLVRRLRKLVRRGTAVEKRDALAAVLGLHGLRITEVRNLLVGDLDHVDELLLVRTLKRGKVRNVRLGPGVFAAVKRLAGRRPKEATLFTTNRGGPVAANYWQGWFRDLTRQVIGGEGRKFHACRHTYAMRVYHNTKDLQRVRALLGQRDERSTQVYVEAYGELDDRTMRRLGEVATVPSLKAGRAKSREPGAGSGKTRAGTRRVPEGKASAKRGKNADFREIDARKNEKAHFGAQKSAIATPAEERLRLWIVSQANELERRDERKTG